MSLFPDGLYKIFSTQFPGQDADLYHGLPNAPIVGYHNNTASNNMVWNLTNVGTLGNQFTFINAAPTAKGAYAGVTDEITIGTELFGSPNPLTWTVVPTCNSGEYMILAPAASGSDIPSGLVWSLSSGEDGTPITLQPISYTTNSNSKTLRTRQEYHGNWKIGPT